MRPSIYPIVLEPLLDEVGDGFAAFVPDLLGCMSDGETPEEALANVHDATEVLIETAGDLGREAPDPSQHLARAG